jgi:hypothetical protein
MNRKLRLTLPVVPCNTEIILIVANQVKELETLILEILKLR